MKALQQFLRPEFINRVDAVITFNRLSKENFKEIAKIMLGELVRPPWATRASPLPMMTAW